ncbi:hypothetical protein FBQ88_12395 [Gammaproteobacteria bacterium PRO2]|nr:hypothetical protein [Gammaproteobacteria bacterium PRO2]
MFGFSVGGSKSKSSSSPWGPQQGYLKDVWAQGQNLFNQWSGPASTFGSQMLGMGQQLMPALGSAFNYWTDALNGDPALAAAQLRGDYRTLTENYLPGIDARSIGMGNYGGSRPQIAAAIAERGFADRVADVMATQRNLAANNLQQIGAMGGNLGVSGIGLPMDLLTQYGALVQAGNWGGTTKGKNAAFGFTAGLDK